MTVSPAQNFSKPPPVPDFADEISTSGFSPLNCSATAVVSGPTVLEPSMRSEPDRPVGTSRRPSVVLSSSPQAATPSASSAAVARECKELAWVHFECDSLSVDGLRRWSELACVPIGEDVPRGGTGLVTPLFPPVKKV